MDRMDRMDEMDKPDDAGHATDAARADRRDLHCVDSVHPVHPVHSPGAFSSPSLSPALERFLLIAILALAALLRFPRLDVAPPGLWYDEALDLRDAARAALEGPRIVYPDVFPREPMFITMLIAWGAAFGRGVTEARAMSATIGVATVLALYGMARRWAGPRVALLAAWMLAAMGWHVLFSRLLFRTLLLPLWIVLIAWAAKSLRDAIRDEDRDERSEGAEMNRPTGLRSAPARAALLGALVGGGFYTYLSWFFLLPGVGALCAWALWPAGEASTVARACRPGVDPDGEVEDPGTRLPSPPNPSSAPKTQAGRLCHIAFALALIAVAAPIGIDYALHPDHILARPGAVSIFNGPDPAREIARNLVQALGMFHVRGDHVPKQNLRAEAPALDPVQGALFALGVAVAFVRARRRDPLALLALGWLALGIAPTIFTKTDSPNQLRTLVATPAIALLGAMGAEQLLRAGSRLRAKTRAPDEERAASPESRSPNGKNATPTGLKTKLSERGVAPTSQPRALARNPFVVGHAPRFAVPSLLVCIVVVLLVTTAALVGVFAHRGVREWSRARSVWESFSGPETDLGRKAARTPEGVEFWAPAFLTEHLSFRYMAASERPRPALREMGGELAANVRAYADFAFLRGAPPGPGPSPSPRPRRVIATVHNGILPSLERLVPSGRVVEELRTPDGRVWAVVFEIPAGALPAPEAVFREEAAILGSGRDIRW